MPSVAAAGGLPTRLGKYEILTPLATGGMARIYVARTTGIGSFERHVVLKLITPERANDTTAVQMFLDEARLAASLNHQNVAQVFEVGEDVGIHYLAMEYVHGQDLRALLAKAGGQGTRVPLELALTVVAGAAAGLNHAHERRDSNGVPLGIVHRDVSPSNIMIGYDGAVKLLDFGIAKATSRSVETQSGIIKGKFAYMAPEQCRGRDVDRRSDVFSLGIILYEITTQHRCFRADSDFDTMHRIVTGDVVRPTRLVQGYPQALEAIVMKALAVDANQRYQSAGLLLEAIESFAVSSRMSLSTMALGRFMRDMFGEMPEPWLVGSRGSQHVIPQPKESTISNTNGSREVHQVPTRAPSPRLASEGSPINAARTLLDLPRDHQEADSEPNPNPVEWNARSYPQLQPQYASTATLPPEAMMARASQPSMPQQPVAPPAPPPPTPASMPLAGVPGSTSSTAAAAAAIARGSQPIPPALQPVAPLAPPIVSTKHGYANAPGNSYAGMSQSEVSYPRYEPPADSADDLRLAPNRRPLYIGIGIVAVGVVIVLAIALTGGSVKEEPVTPPRTETVTPTPPPTTVEPAAETPPANNTVAPPQGSAQPPAVDKPAPTPGSAKPADTPVTTPQGSAAVDDGPQPGDESISIHVISDPPGADVLLAGKVIGTTPLTTKLPRGTGSAMLTVHKARYVDVQTKLDLTGSDFSKTVTLKKVDEKPEPKKTPVVEKKTPVVEKKTPVVEKKQPAVVKDPPKEPKEPVKEPPKEPKEPPKPKCQPPGRIDPFDTSCNGGPCPPCPT